MTDWLKKVADGNFGEIPWNPTFEEASKLALLIDGDAVAGVEKCMAISNRVAADMRRMGRTRASALDIWLALYGLQRAHAFAGQTPSNEDQFLFDEFVRVLRAALVSLTSKQKAGIISLMCEDAPKSSS